MKFVSASNSIIRSGCNFLALVNLTYILYIFRYFLLKINRNLYRRLRSIRNLIRVLPAFCSLSVGIRGGKRVEVITDVQLV
jgi:hypothetical protein